jgi:EAL domain-containing protein (putative c-di-GMP-specific phosphodiesterase class I)
MYEAKRLGAAQSVVFDEQLRQRAEAQMTIQSELRSALRNHELVVHYQPVVDLVTGAMDGVEALVRWRHPRRGLVMPGDFIPIAERSDLIDGISAFVLAQACTDAAWWARAGHLLPVAVNISAAQLGHEHVATTIQEALYNSGLAASSLVLEITETALMLGSERALENVDAIRALGVRVALDDFGTGYSSLSYLKRVPADIVKIDRSFVMGVADEAVDRDIAAAIINLAQALGRSVVAEGVETDAQHAALRQLGCPLAQGFLWSKAVPAEAVLPLARVGALRPRSAPVHLVR